MSTTITINRVRELLLRQREKHDDYDSVIEAGMVFGRNEVIDDMMALLTTEEVAKSKTNKSRNDDINEEHF